MLGPGDAIEEPTDWPEAIVDAGVGFDRMLELLQDRPLAAVGERVRGKEQDGQAISGRGRGSGDHVRRARSDRGRAGEGGHSPSRFCVADRRVDHRLLVLGLVEGEVFVASGKGLPEAADVAVAKDSKDTRDQALALTVSLAPLGGEEANQGLGGGQPHCARTHCARTLGSVGTAVSIHDTRSADR